MDLTITAKPADVLRHECVVCGFFLNERPPKGHCGLVDWRLNGIISKLIKKGTLSGAFTEKVLITPTFRIPSSKILLFGLGNSTDLTYERVYEAGHNISHTVTGIDCYDTAFDIPEPGRCNLDVAKMTTAMISGYIDGFFQSRSHMKSVSVCVMGDEPYRDEITLGANQFKVNVKDRVKVMIVEG